MIRLYSWNVNGIRAAHKKGLLDWVREVRPDILGLQETKAQPEQLDEALSSPEGYHAYWSSAERKGYSGVGLYSVQEPDSVKLGLGIEAYDREGRTIIADYGDFVLINAYFPNGGRDHSRVPFKMAFKAHFLEVCNQLLAQGREVIFCGDVNTAHQEIDLARPKQNQKTTGFLPIERACCSPNRSAIPSRGARLPGHLPPAASRAGAGVQLVGILGGGAPAERRLAHRLLLHLARPARARHRRRNPCRRHGIGSLPGEPDVGFLIQQPSILENPADNDRLFRWRSSHTCELPLPLRT